MSEELLVVAMKQQGFKVTSTLLGEGQYAYEMSDLGQTIFRGKYVPDPSDMPEKGWQDDMPLSSVVQLLSELVSTDAHKADAVLWTVGQMKWLASHRAEKLKSLVENLTFEELETQQLAKFG